MNQCANGGLTLNEMIGMIAVSNSDCVATASESHELVRLYRMMEGNEQFQQPKLVTKCVGSTDALAINPSGTILCCSGKYINTPLLQYFLPVLEIISSRLSM